jgi:hypothetical protein
MEKKIVSKFLYFILIFAFSPGFGFGQISDCYPIGKNSSDTLIVVVNRYQDKTNYTVRESKDLKSKPFTEIRIHRTGFSDPNFDISLFHVTANPICHSQMDFTNSDISRFLIYWDREMDFSKWSKLGSFSSSRTVFMVFEDEVLNKDRFVFGHKFKAFQIEIRTGAIE